MSFSVDPISSDGVTFSADVSDTVGFDVMESRCVSSDAICDALLLVTIQPPPNQLANIDFDVIGTSDY